MKKIQSHTKLLLLLFSLAISFTCFAQDIIITKDAKKINAKVLRINPDNVKYKDFDDPDGPTQTILKSNVASILYENGEVEAFASETAPAPQTQQSSDRPAVKENNTNKNPAPAGDKATVYFIRNSGLGSLIRMTIECDGQKIGSTKPKQYVYTTLDPGEYTFASKGGENKATLGVRLEAGEVYYIKQQVKMGIVAARTGLELMNEEDGIKALKECKLSSDNLYAPDNNENVEVLQKPENSINSDDEALSQNSGIISNGTLEILEISLPDSIVFKFAEGKAAKVKYVFVYLVNNKENIPAKEVVANPVNVNPNDKAWTFSYSDETKFCAKGFAIYGNTEIQKIKFVIAGGRTMYYNLQRSQWE